MRLIKYCFLHTSKVSENTQTGDNLKKHPLHPFIMEDIGLNYVIRCADCGLKITAPYEIKNNYRYFLRDNFWVIRNSRPYCPKCYGKTWGNQSNSDKNKTSSNRNEFI